MDKFIDLHTHSTVSDGTMTPSELVRHAKKSGLSAIALTDHDTIDGVDEAMKEGKSAGIEVIAGVEISADFAPHSEMHLLGYFFDGNHKNITSLLERLKASRDERNPKIIKKLNELGIDITLEEVKAEAKDKLVGRPHIASVLVKKGYVKNISEAFEKYISVGRPAYVKREKLLPKEAIEEIKKCGGIPVLAHPIYLGVRTIEELNALLKELKGYGLEGIEVFYSDNMPHETILFLKLAVEYDLVPTGGSDFHGYLKPHISIGTGRGDLYVPYKVLEEMKKLAEKKGRVKSYE
ncbi:PHP domain-containing protein [Acetivibrio saccincola]|jgi:predicted metal-dependent phosphoesterase TrpH|uniref:Error-prone DNA polymerase n=1 Tax=Acetivibrio saccincola TaxID=1677857 RepID=A0A2K9EPC5_9FIRM|nr:PHP domain-containing protein [Acetivibrio saccincola]AUG58481.1 Error-prone DNA polymerase [Acetivibrio saccincola]NLW26841.1 PHP domain-containing protein [Acetivibrio saccincola]PQQ66318.1 phosphoesterase [Acetivibrio saccincola]HOA97893.1 PHP domain-containing protein [Acetivibrio saccincola]HQD28624.1 PHP domain-containing protein [Acetivibrio saccincola]